MAIDLESGIAREAIEAIGQGPEHVHHVGGQSGGHGGWVEGLRVR